MLIDNANAIANADIIDRYVKLVNLLAQDRIVSKVNFSQLSSDLEALKQIIPDDKATTKERQEFLDQFLKMWNTAFNLTPELLNLSTEETYEIDEHYFYINLLILDCQKVAVNISPTVWQEIEERMLRVP
ncbi:NACHT C-terminal helical domain 2-containing protein [Microcystis aeruginosa]